MYSITFSYSISTVQYTFQVSNTVKPLLFKCPLFRKFRDTYKAAKLKGTNIYTVATLIIISIENLQLTHH